MTTKRLFKLAYGAARLAFRFDSVGQPSPFAAGLDATIEHMDFPARFKIVGAAAAAAELHMLYRMRQSSRVMLRPQTSFKLANRRIVAELKRGN